MRARQKEKHHKISIDYRMPELNLQQLISLVGMKRSQREEACYEVQMATSWKSVFKVHRTELLVGLDQK